MRVKDRQEVKWEDEREVRSTPAGMKRGEQVGR